MHVDLTSVGFTPTESLAYAALIELGPSSGYAVAQAISVARANAYQALHGLTRKGAAVKVADAPQQFRAVNPEAVLALAAQREAHKLDELERQLRSLESSGAASLVWFSSERELREVVLRTALRSPGVVTCLAPGRVLALLVPIWRKREADGATTKLWAVGSVPDGVTVAATGRLDPGDAARYFAAAPVLVSTDEAVVSGIVGERITGFWTSESVIVSLVQAAIARLTGT